jgi:hypothetical protein
MQKSIRNTVSPYIILCFLSILLACSSSKSGCPATDNAQVKMGKNGELPKGHGKSSVFPKEVKKKVGVR